MFWGIPQLNQTSGCNARNTEKREFRIWTLILWHAMLMLWNSIIWSVVPMKTWMRWYKIWLKKWHVCHQATGGNFETWIKWQKKYFEIRPINLYCWQYFLEWGDKQCQRGHNEHSCAIFVRDFFKWSGFSTMNKLRGNVDLGNEKCPCFKRGASEFFH